MVMVLAAEMVVGVAEEIGGRGGGCGLVFFFDRSFLVLVAIYILNY